MKNFIATAVLVILNVMAIYAQNRIYGTVTDRNGEPLAGVNIREKGTGNGTVSDKDGRYSFVLKGVSGGNPLIVFSFIGMEQKIVRAKVSDGGETRIDAVLEESLDEIAGVEVVGIGERKEIRDVKQSVVRGGDEALIFYSYNPPEDPKNWVNKEARKNKETRLVHHSTYLDVNPEWLGKPFFIEAEDLKNSNPLAYRNEYLGEEVGTGLNVFTNVELRKIPKEEINRFDNLCEGIDWGYAVDPFVWIKVHYERKYKRLYIFDEIYGTGISNREAIARVDALADPYTPIYADSAEPKSIREFKDAALYVKAADKGPGSVEFGIKFLQGLTHIYIDPHRCPNAWREFSLYELEKDRNGEWKREPPDKDNHAVDGTRYALCKDTLTW